MRPFRSKAEFFQFIVSSTSQAPFGFIYIKGAKEPVEYCEWYPGKAFIKVMTSTKRFML
jgi:hypothetical protein